MCSTPNRGKQPPWKKLFFYIIGLVCVFFGFLAFRICFLYRVYLFPKILQRLSLSMSKFRPQKENPMTNDFPFLQFRCNCETSIQLLKRNRGKRVSYFQTPGCRFTFLLSCLCCCHSQLVYDISVIKTTSFGSNETNTGRMFLHPSIVLARCSS